MKKLFGIRKIFLNVALPLLFMCVCACSGCSVKQPEPVSKTGFYFDTVITITLYDKNADSLIDGCFELAEKYEKMFSATIKDSEVSKINRAGSAFVTVSDETLELLQKGLEYCELSEGGFDITIGKLSSLWDFSGDSDAIPNEDDIKDAVSTIGYQNVVLDGNQAQLANPDAAIDLGAIAKGFIADKMKAYLKDNGITAGMINLGGNVLCIGAKPDKTPYRVGIQRPFDEQGATAAVVEIEDETVVTSGVYERYLKTHDTLYHHILNPATGYPYDNGLFGVSIICGHSVDGDGLSTACFSLGLEKGMELIESLPNTEAIFITDDYKLHCSSGIGDAVLIEETR